MAIGYAFGLFIVYMNTSKFIRGRVNFLPVVLAAFIPVFCWSNITIELIDANNTVRISMLTTGIMLILVPVYLAIRHNRM